MTFVKSKNKNFFPNVLGSFVDEFLNDEVNPFIEKTMINRFPAVNIVETDTEYVLHLMAPGRSKDVFTINVEKGILTIADATEYKKDEETKFTKKEFSLGSFKRSFTLSDKVDANKINAAYENGILVLTIAKKEEAIAPKRTIEVS